MEILWLLLPLAALSGWWAAKRNNKKIRRQSSAHLTPDYYQGLNYLLNEQQDKALEVFLRLVEANSETIETHMALAGLFRRRGEVERAIRIHQNLLARPSLEQTQRSLALLELAKDYMHAGLLDRAENLFSELVKQRYLTVESLRSLLDIYQRESEWFKAIEIARKLVAIKQLDVKPVIAHCYCEISILYQRDGELEKAIHALENAIVADSKSIRAHLNLGDLYKDKGDFFKAYEYYVKICVLDEEFISEVLERIVICIDEGISSQVFDKHIRLISQDHKDVILMPKLIDYIHKTKGIKAASEYADKQLDKILNLNSLKEWVQYQQILVAEPDPKMEKIFESLKHIVHQTPGYQCRNCGYNTMFLSWQCPSCKSWSTIKPSIQTY